MLRKVALAFSILFLLLGCNPSPEEYIQDTSIEFAENLHDYSFVNEKWFNEASKRAEALSQELINQGKGPLLSYNLEEVYPEYTEAVEKAFSKITDEAGLDQVKKHLKWNRMHQEKETVEFDSIIEYESSYSAVVYLTSSFEKLRLELCFIKTEPKPLITGFKVKVLEFQNPQ